jgi:hypothetical protein
MNPAASPPQPESGAGRGALMRITRAPPVVSHGVHLPWAADSAAGTAGINPVAHPCFRGIRHGSEY